MDLFFKINIIVSMVRCKQLLASAILSSYFLSSGLAFADTYQGHAEMFDQKTLDQSELFTGKVDIIDQKDVIKMTVSQVIDGNISIEGDEFFAEVVSDVSGD